MEGEDFRVEETRELYSKTEESLQQQSRTSMEEGQRDEDEAAAR